MCVKQAFVFGSWAARYTGEPGPPPRDIDVVIVGEAALRGVRRACSQLQSELRVEVNPVVVSPQAWSAAEPEPFVARLRSQPLVSVPIEHP